MLNSVNVVNDTDDYSNLESVLHSWAETHLISLSFYTLMNLFSNILWRILSRVHEGYSWLEVSCDALLWFCVRVMLS